MSTNGRYMFTILNDVEKDSVRQKKSLPDRVRQSRVNLNFHCVSKNEIKRLRKR